jgi:hypothetical protein
MVEVVGTGAEMATLQILQGRASYSEIHNLAIAGPRIGIGTTGSEDVVVGHVWIHDTLDLGIDAEDAYGRTTMTISASLIEATTELGVFVAGSDVTLEATVVRDTQPVNNGTRGRGIQAQLGFAPPCMLYIDAAHLASGAQP